MGRPKKARSIDELLTADEQQARIEEAHGSLWPKCHFNWMAVPVELAGASGISEKQLRNRIAEPNSFYHFKVADVPIGGGKWQRAYFANTTSWTAGDSLYQAHTSEVRRNASGLANVTGGSLVRR